MPEGATDCHMHIFGPQDRYPQSPVRTYTAPPASIERYRDLAEALGLSLPHSALSPSGADIWRDLARRAAIALMNLHAVASAKCDVRTRLAPKMN